MRVWVGVCVCVCTCACACACACACVCEDSTLFCVNIVHYSVGDDQLYCTLLCVADDQ